MLDRLLNALNIIPVRNELLAETEKSQMLRERDTIEYEAIVRFLENVVEGHKRGKVGCFETAEGAYLITVKSPRHLAKKSPQRNDSKDRLERIETFLKTVSVTTMRQLKQKFNKVSERTLRRDMQKLEAKGKVKQLGTTKNTQYLVFNSKACFTTPSTK